MMHNILVTIAVLFLVGTIACLESFDNFQEASCSELRMKPLTSINRPWLDSLKYTVAGSKYHLYRLAFGHPDYQTLRDDDFYYNFCPRRNISTTKKMGELTIFERKLAAFDVRIPQKDDDKSGIYLESLSKNPLQRWDINRQHVTLTDNMTFAFLTICWTGADQRAWEVISADDKLDLQAKKRVMEHAESLGFRKENFVFLRPDSCVKVAH